MSISRPDGLPADLAGIDMQAGLETAALDAGLYRKLLLMFRKNNADFAAHFALARSGADPSAATRLAHTLKGTAGNIGAFGVMHAAGRLEALCAKNAAPHAVDGALAAAVKELDAVLPGLNTLSIPVTATPVAHAVQDPQWGQKLARLRTLLQGSDAEAMDLAGELSGCPPDDQAAEALRLVTTALDNFDFEAALSHLPPA